MNTRLVPFLASAALAAALLLAACGGGGSDGADPASVAPAKSPLYIEAAVHPEGELKSNVEALAEKIAGVENLGELIVNELQKWAGDSGEELDFATEVEPWLGEKGGLFFESYDGNDFSGYGVAIQTSDAGATEEFIEKHTGSEGEPAEKGSFEGVDYEIYPGGSVLGVTDDLLLATESLDVFKHAVEAANGESLADDETFSSTMDAASDESLADVYIDVGGLLEQAGGEINPETDALLESSGIDPENATAVASLVPGSDQIEIDFSTNVGNSEPGDASKLLETMPGGSFAAFGTADFGKQLAEGIDALDEQGIPGEIEPGQLKATLGAIGIDLDKLAESFKEVAVFAQGNTENNLTGALVFTTTGPEAKETVEQIGKLLRVSGQPGVTLLSGKASGFSVRSPSLGSQPLVVATEGDRVAISYGAAASVQALSASEGATLAKDPAFEEAKKSLGSTPISGFVDGPAALALIQNLLPADELEEFEEAKPYLDKLAFAAVGAGSSGDLTTSKVILGLTE
ncbi:MAG TPA: DUF3352 domain-containing protein [Solirubrobacterales bacterium]|nr:DUF3352 domain-containing protein [Solirubrobacterales bacterium]